MHAAGREPMRTAWRRGAAWAAGSAGASPPEDPVLMARARAGGAGALADTRPCVRRKHGHAKWRVGLKGAFGVAQSWEDVLGPENRC